MGVDTSISQYPYGHLVSTLYTRVSLITHGKKTMRVVVLEKSIVGRPLLNIK